MVEQVLRYFLNLEPRALEILQAPRYINPALHTVKLFLKIEMRSG